MYLLQIACITKLILKLCHSYEFIPATTCSHHINPLKLQLQDACIILFRAEFSFSLVVCSVDCVTN